VRLEDMQEVDRYALARYGEVAAAALKAYDDYDFPVIFQRVNQLVTVDLSAFYADVSKDRLYTFAASSKERRSAQSAMYRIADGLVRLLAPVLPVTADELWRHLPGKREASVHLGDFPEAAEVAAMMDQDLVARWERLIRVRNVVNAALEAKRQDKTIGTSLGARVAVRTSGETAALLERYRDDLPMLFIVSDVALESGPDGDDTLEVAVERAEGQKCARCWRVVPQVSSSPGTEGLCDRCMAAITGT
jgi:isoleucyl-tRNA synthetase